MQSNHIHLIAEAENKGSLARGMKGLAVRIAKGVNRAVGRTGSLFAERYHAHVLKTRREVAHAIEYVLGNWFRHAGREFGAWDYDKLSSAFEPSMVVPPQTWLLRIGWEAA